MKWSFSELYLACVFGQRDVFDPVDKKKKKGKNKNKKTNVGLGLREGMNIKPNNCLGGLGMS